MEVAWGFKKKKNSSLFLGVMSGTSLDAIDVVLVDFNERIPKLIASHSSPISLSLREQLHAICHPGENEINRLGILDNQMGKLFAEACLTLLNNTQISFDRVRAIGSHGQTVRHQPQGNYPFTLQIGDPSVIAHLTGITTVADFRRRDMAAGGQGAPLVPAFHNYLFRHSQLNRIILNIGGIANITLLPAKSDLPIIGFDTGPGNTLLDEWIHHHYDQLYDDQGRWAQSGTVIPELLSKFLSDPYFKQDPPKSTGKEKFNLMWIKKHLTQEEKPADVQATLLELTAQTISQMIQKHLFPRGDIIVCGGGAYNAYLLERITALNADHRLMTSAQLNLEPRWVEPTAFAWLAQQTLLGQPGNIPSVTGAKNTVILGGIYRSGSVEPIAIS